MGYYDQSYPPSLWAPVVIPATGADAGIPGTWTPVDSQPPATVADLIGGIPNAVVANPATPWTTGQYVQTATVGIPGRATWTGTNWVGGVAPAVEETPAPEPTTQEPPAEYTAVPVTDIPPSDS